jgi:hypothetical protein
LEKPEAARSSLSKFVANPRRGQREAPVNTELTTVTATLPVCIEPAITDPITSTACLAFLERSAKAALENNLRTLAAAVLYIYAATVWTQSKTDRKSMKEVKAILAKVFSEQENPNLNAKRSKRYKFAKLSVEIASHKDIRPLAINAAELKSIEAGVAYLTKQFSERAKSVADLARHFGSERTRQRVEEEPVRQPFLYLLRSLVEKAEKNEQRIPFAESVKLLASAATQRDFVELIRDLIPHTADNALPELVEFLNRDVERRQANA